MVEVLWVAEIQKPPTPTNMPLDHRTKLATPSGLLALSLMTGASETPRHRLSISSLGKGGCAGPREDTRIPKSQPLPQSRVMTMAETDIYGMLVGSIKSRPHLLANTGSMNKQMT